MHIGLIGGIGPASTIHYYRLLLDKIADLELTISHAHIKTLAPNIAARKADEQAVVFARHVDSLKSAGADVAVVTSIAAHFCISELIELSFLPIINILDSLQTHFNKNEIEKIGLLGNELSMKSHLFGMIDNVEFVLPREDLITPVGEAYMKMASRRDCEDGERSLFIQAGNDMVASGGADAVLLGGTDLFLAFEKQNVSYPVIDAVAVHVEDIARTVHGEV